MMKILTRCASVVCLLSLAASAYAAKVGSYVGIGGGYSRVQASNPSLNLSPNATTTMSHSNSLNGFAGRVFTGYNFNQNFGVEVGATRYAQASAVSSATDTTNFTSSNLKNEYSMYAVDAVGKAYLPLAAGFDIYALAGGAYVHSNMKSTTSGGWTSTQPALVQTPETNTTTNALRPIVGAGVSYAIPNTQLATNLEVSRIISNTDNVPSANLATINLVYNLD
jgi:opacity protein-like surface antigen